MDRMALYPVHRLIFKIVFKMMGKACGVLRTSGVFLCGFAALRAKKCQPHRLKGRAGLV
jgi:hypothetical protein